MKLGPLYIGNRHYWRYAWVMRQWCGIFRNCPDVKPGRWGFYILGFEFGSRNPGNRFGMFLKRIGLWRW